MLLDAHEHNLALYLAAAGERARGEGGAVPDRGFADTLRTRLIAQATEPLPKEPREPRRSRRPRVAWTLPAFLRLPRLPPLLPVAVVSLLLLAGVVAAHEVFVVFESLPPAGSPSAITAGASGGAGATDSAAPSDSLASASGEPSSQPTPEGTTPVGAGPTPRPTPRPSGAPTPKPSGAPTSPPTPGPTAPPTPVPTAVPTPVPTATPGPTVPDAPILVSAISGPSSGEVLLGWLPPLDDGGDAVIGYRVCQSDTQGGPYTCVGTGSLLTVNTISGLTPGNQYWFRIQAVNGIGAGPMSNEDTAFATP